MKAPDGGAKSGARPAFALKVRRGKCVMRERKNEKNRNQEEGE
jgi:hypothetical protein